MDNKATVPAEEISRLKGLGLLRDKTTEDCFNARVITGNGMVSADQINVIAKAAELYGNGKMCMTTRLTIEVQCIPYKNVDAFIAYLAENNLETGGTGPKVRPVVSCKGTTCQYGLIDTYKLSEEIHERFYKGYHQVKLPHKFKIAVGGCPNNCVKPELNDLGIIGQKVPTVDVEKCRSCKVCQVIEACPIKIAHFVDGKISINKSECNNCGRCDGKCPFGAVSDYTYGYRVYIGGRWGKKTAQAKLLSKVFTSKEDVLDIIEKAINYFKENGNQGERFADTIKRIGFENVEKALLS